MSLRTGIDVGVAYDDILMRPPTSAGTCYDGPMLQKPLSRCLGDGKSFQWTRAAVTARKTTFNLKVRDIFTPVVQGFSAMEAARLAITAHAIVATSVSGEVHVRTVE